MKLATFESNGRQRIGVVLTKGRHCWISLLPMRR